jgi:hypothetical protein
MSAVTLLDMTTIPAMAERSGIAERTLRYWMDTDFHGFRRECTLKVGGRRLVNLPATAEWLKRVGHTETLVQEGA